MNLNKAFVLGNVTRDPEQKKLPSGSTVASFGIATNRFYKQNEEKKQEVEFHNIVLFGRLAEIASEYIKKGSLVLIEGRIKTRNWADTSGNKHYKTEIIGETLQLGPRAGQTTGQGFEKPSTSKENEIPIIEEDPVDNKNDKEIDVSDIPF